MYYLKWKSKSSYVSISGFYRENWIYVHKESTREVSPACSGSSISTVFVLKWQLSYKRKTCVLHLLIVLNSFFTDSIMTVGGKGRQQSHFCVTFMWIVLVRMWELECMFRVTHAKTHCLKPLTAILHKLYVGMIFPTPHLYRSYCTGDVTICLCFLPVPGVDKIFYCLN